MEKFPALPDPALRLRTQANIWSTGSRHFIHNLSLANPVSINGKEIVAETDVEFHAGDQIQVGLYVLRADAVELAAEEQASEVASETLAPAAQVQAETAPEAQSDEIKTNTQAEAPSASPAATRLSTGKEVPAAQPPQFLLRPEVVASQGDAAGTDNKSVAQAETQS